MSIKLKPTKTDLKIQKIFEEKFLDEAFDEGQYMYALLYTDPDKNVTPIIRRISNETNELNHIILLSNSLKTLVAEVDEDVKRKFLEGLNEIIFELKSTYLIEVEA